MTPPGLGFVAAGNRARETHKKADLRTPYWDWTEREGQRTTRNMPARRPSICCSACARRSMLSEEGLDNMFRRHQLLAEAVRRAVAVWAEGKAFGFNITARRALEHGTPVLQRPRPRCAARLLQREVRRGAGPRHRRDVRQGVPHRPYGARQCADDARHAQRGRMALEALASRTAGGVQAAID